MLYQCIKFYVVLWKKYGQYMGSDFNDFKKIIDKAVKSTVVTS